MDPLTDGVYRKFCDGMGLGIFLVEPGTWRFKGVNRAFCGLTKFAESEIGTKSLLELLQPEDASEVEPGLSKGLRRDNDQFSFEKRFVRGDGTVGWFQADLALKRDEAGHLTVMGLLKEVTDRNMATVELENARQKLEANIQKRTAELAATKAALRAEMKERECVTENLHETNQTLQTLMQASPLSIFTLDREGRIRLWNSAAVKVFGWTEKEVVGRPLRELPFDQARDRMESLQSIMQEGRASYFETRQQDREGRTMDIRVWCAPNYSDDGQVTGGVAVIMDVTRQKLLQRALLEASEREQRRIGQDLHDHLCQQLLGAAFAAKALAGRMDREGTPVGSDLHRLATVINDAVKQARDIARGLNPVELDSAGLMAALQEMAARVRITTECVLECEHPVLLPDTEAALHAYRIAQEAVANAIKHANATRIVLKLAETQDSVIMEIADNGSGIDAAVAAKGMGLESMRYRAEAIGGKLVVEKAEGGGTRVVCRFPKRK